MLWKAEPSIAYRLDVKHPISWRISNVKFLQSLLTLQLNECIISKGRTHKHTTKNKP